MSRGVYAFLVGLPAIIVLGIVGRTAKYIESYAGKTRMACANTLRRVMDGAPKVGSE